MTDVNEPSLLGKSNSDEPDWNGDDARIVVRDQAATAVFVDEQGDVLVWQRDSFGAEGRVFLTPQNAQLVAKAILKLVSNEESQLLLAPPAKDRTAAERARRYRNKRDADRDATVTERDASVTELRVVRGSS